MRVLAAARPLVMLTLLLMILILLMIYPDSDALSQDQE
jgi:hypothetical protein